MINGDIHVVVKYASETKPVFPSYSEDGGAAGTGIDVCGRSLPEESRRRTCAMTFVAKKYSSDSIRSLKSRPS